MTKRKAAILGNPNSIFVQQLSSVMQTLEITPTIFTYSSRIKVLPNGTEIITNADTQPKLVKSFSSKARYGLGRLENLYFRINSQRYASAMQEYKGEHPVPYASWAVINGLGMARSVKKFQPDFVFGLEAFNYGFATAMSGVSPRCLMPWGGDIFNFARTSPFAHALTRFSLRNCDLICPTSISAGKFIKTQFHVGESAIYPVSWGVDQKQFVRASDEERVGTCQRYNIRPDSTIVMNVRRFNPAWGSNIALEAFLRLSEQDENYHFILLGNSFSKEYLVKEKARIAPCRAARFTFFEDEISLQQCADLMAVSDIFTSLMQKNDMRSASILQATACGAAPVLAEQAEYREMERLGFSARFVKPYSVEDVAEAIRLFANQPQLRENTAKQNFRYIGEHEDGERNFKRMFAKITALITDFSS